MIFFLSGFENRFSGPELLRVYSLDVFHKQFRNIHWLLISNTQPAYPSYDHFFTTVYYFQGYMHRSNSAALRSERRGQGIALVREVVLNGSPSCLAWLRVLIPPCRCFWLTPASSDQTLGFPLFFCCQTYLSDLLFSDSHGVVGFAM